MGHRYLEYLYVFKVLDFLEAPQLSGVCKLMIFNPCFAYIMRFLMPWHGVMIFNPCFAYIMRSLMPWHGVMIFNPCFAYIMRSLMPWHGVMIFNPCFAYIVRSLMPWPGMMIFNPCFAYIMRSLMPRLGMMMRMMMMDQQQILNLRQGCLYLSGYKQFLWNLRNLEHF